MSAAAPTGTSTLVSFPRSRRNVAGDKWSKWRCETRATSTLGRCSGAIPGATRRRDNPPTVERSEEHTSELQSPCNLVCRLLLEKKKQLKNCSREVVVIPLCDCRAA